MTSENCMALLCRFVLLISKGCLPSTLEARKLISSKCCWGFSKSLVKKFTQLWNIISWIFSRFSEALPLSLPPLRLKTVLNYSEYITVNTAPRKTSKKASNDSRSNNKQFFLVLHFVLGEWFALKCWLFTRAVDRVPLGPVDLRVPCAYRIGVSTCLTVL